MTNFFLSNTLLLNAVQLMHIHRESLAFVYNITNLKRFCRVMAVVSNTKFLQLMFLYDNINTV